MNTRKSLYHANPPPFDSLPIQRLRIRYAVTADVNDIVLKSTDLFGGIGVIPLSTSTTPSAFVIAQMARLECIHIWSPLVSSSASPQAGTCSIRVGNVPSAGGNADTGLLAPRRTFTDSTTNTAKPAHIKYVPPKSSMAGSWHPPNTLANSSSLLSLDATSGSVIDLEVCYILNRATTSAVQSVALSLSNPSGSVINQIYVAGLSGSSSIVPRGDYLTTTITA